MTVHVFVGAGPANLAKAQQLVASGLGPRDKLIFIDKRLQQAPDSEQWQFERSEARSNIFRIDRPVVNDMTAKDFIEPEPPFELNLNYPRPWDPRRFQPGDEDVFGKGDFNVIQIRDLEQGFLDLLAKVPKEQVSFQRDEVKGDINRRTVEAVVLPLLSEEDHDQDIAVHTARGIGQAGAKDTMVYRVQLADDFSRSSPDLKAMPVLPQHGTQSYRINADESVQFGVHRHFDDRQLSLSQTAWQGPLKACGWELVRPPRVRILHVGDILYVGTEVPEEWAALTSKTKPTGEAKSEAEIRDDKANYDQKIQRLTQTICNLTSSDLTKPLFGGLLTPYQSAQFPTTRMEYGTPIELLEANPKGPLTGKISIYHQGDESYAPHYQTGSGFVIAYLVGRLQVDIDKQASLKALVEFALEAETVPGQMLMANPGGLESDALSEEIIAHYQKILKDPTDANILRALKAELYAVGRQDMIYANKEKVGSYFEAIHRETIGNLARVLDEEISEKYPGLDKQHYPIVAARELREMNTVDLRAIIPTLMNIKLPDELPEHEIHRIRDLFVRNTISCFPPADIKAAINAVNQVFVYERKSKGVPDAIVGSIAKLMDIPASALQAKLHNALTALQHSSGSKGPLDEFQHELDKPQVQAFFDEIMELQEAHARDELTAEEVQIGLGDATSTLLHLGSDNQLLLALLETVDKAPEEMPGMEASDQELSGSHQASVVEDEMNPSDALSAPGSQSV